MRQDSALRAEVPIESPSHSLVWNFPQTSSIHFDHFLLILQLIDTEEHILNSRPTSGVAWPRQRSMETSPAVPSITQPLHSHDSLRPWQTRLVRLHKNVKEDSLTGDPVIVDITFLDAQSSTKASARCNMLHCPTHGAMDLTPNG